MSYDRKDHLALVEKNKVDRERDMMPMYRVLQGAAPIMTEMMTGSDAWDRYLTILQGFVERLKIARAAAETRLADPAIWEAHQLIKLKSDVREVDAMLTMLKTAMELPKALIEGGDAAKEIIAKFEEKHAEPAGHTEP